MNIVKLFEKLKDFFGEKILAIILLQFITNENIIKTIDVVLDFFENLADKTSTPFDNEILKKIRAVLEIPDNDK